MTDLPESNMPTRVRGRQFRAAAPVIERALRGVRVTFAVVLLLAAWVRSESLDIAGWSPDVRVGALLLALAVLVINAVSFTRSQGDTTGRSALIDIAHIGADIVLTISLMFALDAEATPLAWIALVLPIVTGAVRYGFLGGAGAWTAASLAYLATRLGWGTGPASSTADTLYLSFQQLFAVLLIAVPGLYLTHHLNGQIEASRIVRTATQRRANRLQKLTQAARKMSGRSEPEVLDEVVRCASQMGFFAADVCVRTSTGNWVASHTTGATPGHGPTLDALATSVSNGQSVVLGSESSADIRQALHLSGSQSAAIVPIDGHSLILRAWSDGSGANAQDEDALESLEALAAQTRSALANARLFNDLSVKSNALEYQANHDALTGLPNRLKLVETVDRALRDLATAPAALSLLFLDLDGFKAANDTFGHEAGDHVLKVIAERLRALTPQTATAARLGGDEFVVLERGLAGGGAPTELATAICDAVRQPITLSNGDLAHLRASIGVAIHRPGMGRDSLLDAADGAMYQAKARGGDTFVLAGVEAEQALRR